MVPLQQPKLLLLIGGIMAPVCILSALALSSDQPVVYDHKTRTSIAEGNAELLSEDARLQADRICYVTENAKGLADGRVRLTHALGRIASNSGFYYVNDKTFAVDSFRMAAFGHGVRGSSMHGTRDCAYAKDVEIDVHGARRDVAGVHIHAKEVEVHPHDAILKKATVKIGKIPVWYLPTYHLKDRSNEQKYCTLWTEADVLSSNRHIRNDLVLNYGRIRPGIMLDYYHKRGPLVGGLLRYDTPYGHGGFRAAGLNDKSYRNQPNVKSKRHWFEWRHQGHIEDRVDISAQVEWMRDKEVIRDIRPNEHDGMRQQADNFTEAVYRGDEFVANVVTRHQLNRFHTVQERLPEARFEYLPVPIGNSPLYHQFGGGVSHVRERRVGESTRRTLKRGDLYYGLSLPMSVSKACSITPLVSGRMISYAGLNNPDHKSTYTRYLGQLGADVRFHAYGDYAHKNKYWNIYDFRHLIQPVIQYRYMPHGHQGHAFVPAIDREVDGGENACSLSEIDLLNRRDIDDMNDMHLMRFGLENFLYAFGWDGSEREWLSAHIYQDVQMKRNWVNGQQQHHLGGTCTKVEWRPADFLSFDQSLYFDLGNKRLKWANTGVTFKESDLWEFRIGHIYLRNTGSIQHQCSFGGTYYLNSRNQLLANTILTFKQLGFVSQSFMWKTVISHIWWFSTEFKWDKLYKWQLLFGLNLSSW